MQQGPIVSLMINVHHSRGLSTCTHQLLANRASARCVTGVKGGRAAPEAATVQECCGRRASPPSCDLLGTLHEPKGRGEACGFVLVFFTSPPQILYCFSGKLLSASAGVLFVAQPVQFAKKKKKGFLRYHESADGLFLLSTLFLMCCGRARNEQLSLSVLSPRSIK